MRLFSTMKTATQRGLARVAKSLGLGQFMPGPRDTRPIFYLDPNYDYANMEHAFLVNPWINAAVRARSEKLASVPLKLYRETGKGEDVEREEVFDHPLVELMYRPNRLQSTFEFIRDIGAEMSLAGETFIFAENGSRGKRLSGLPKSLHLLHPRFIKRIVSPMMGMVTAYEYDQGGSPQMFDPEFVTHIKYYNPESDLRGLPPLTVAKFPYMMKYYMDMYNIAFFKNGGAPKMALTSKGRVSPESKKANVEEFKQNFLGYQNNGKVPHFDSDTVLQELSTTAKDGEFIGFDDMKREEILAIYQTPPVMVTVLDGASYANAKEQARQFYELAIQPTGCLLESGLNRQIVDVWYPGKGLYYAFDYSGIEALKADALRQAQIDHIYLADGKVTINELRQRDDEPEVEWGKKPYNALAAAFASSGLSGGGGVEDDATEDKPEVPSRSRVTRSQIARLRKSTEGRTELWKSIMAPVIVFENRFEGVASDFLEGQKNRVLAKVNDFAGVASAPRGVYQERLTIGPGDLSFIFDHDAEDAKVREVTAPLYRQIVKAAGQAAARTVSDAVEFNVSDPRVAELIGQKIGLIARINNSTREQLNNLLTQSALSNATVEETARMIGEWFDTFTPARSRMIARTEVIGANNGATIEGFRQSGAVEEKEWLSSRDADVRESHVAMDGVRVGLGQLFPNGVDYPAGNGPADETINCRCTLLAVISEAA
jgi:HK97 family phage portal protein